MEYKVFSRYQVYIIALIAVLHFTVILDFMILSPLGAQVMHEVDLTTVQFSYVVSSYAFSAGTAGLLTAAFADKFDRKKLLLFFYGGFIAGTFFCGFASGYYTLFSARIITGLFGGCIGAIGLAIITDLIPIEARGRALDFTQMTYALSQVLGIPLSLFIANSWGWKAPFLLIGIFCLPVSLVVLIFMKPVTGHLAAENRGNGFGHLLKATGKSLYLKAFATATFLAIAVSMLMPFNTAFMVHNLGIPMGKLPLIYVITGVAAILSAPLIGQLSDKFGKYLMFCIGTVFCIGTIYIYCNLAQSTISYVTFISAVMIVGVLMRMVSSSALLSAVPSQTDRGAFMSINAAVQQFSGGLATVLAGLIVEESKNGVLLHYDLLGWVIIVTMVVTAGSMFVINKYVFESIKQKQM